MNKAAGYIKGDARFCLSGILPCHLTIWNDKLQKESGECKKNYFESWYWHAKGPLTVISLISDFCPYHIKRLIILLKVSRTKEIYFDIYTDVNTFTAVEV